VAPSTSATFCSPGTEASASRYSTSVSASGGGNGASGAGAATTADDVVADEDSDAAGWLSLPHAVSAGAHANSAAATAATAV